MIPGVAIGHLLGLNPRLACRGIDIELVVTPCQCLDPILKVVIAAAVGIAERRLVAVVVAQVDVARLGRCDELAKQYAVIMPEVISHQISSMCQEFSRTIF